MSEEKPNTEKMVEVDGTKVSQQQFEEKKQQQPKNEKFTEVEPDKFRTLKRMRD